MLYRVRVAALEDERIRKDEEEEDEAQKGIKRVRYKESKPIRVTSYKESKPICVMNRILARPLISDDHSGRTVDIICAEETGRGEDRVQCPRRNAPIPIRYINRIRSILWTDDTLKSEPHAYADTLGGGGKIYAEDTDGGSIECASAHGGLCNINMLCFVCSTRMKKQCLQHLLRLQILCMRAIRAGWKVTPSHTHRPGI